MRLLSEWAQKLEKMRRDEMHVFQFNFVFSKILSALKQITTHKYICIYIYINAMQRMRADEYCRVYFHEMTEHMGSVQTML